MVIIYTATESSIGVIIADINMANRERGRSGNRGGEAVAMGRLGGGQERVEMPGKPSKIGGRRAQNSGSSPPFWQSRSPTIALMIAAFLIAHKKGNSHTIFPLIRRKSRHI